MILKPNPQITRHNLPFIFILNEESVEKRLLALILSEQIKDTRLKPNQKLWMAKLVGNTALSKC